MSLAVSKRLLGNNYPNEIIDVTKQIYIRENICVSSHIRDVDVEF